MSFISADGSRTKGAKVPYDWQRLNDEQKTAFIKSTKAAMTLMRAVGGGVNGGMGMGGGAAAMDGGQMVIRMDGPGAGGPGGPGGPPRGGGERRIVMGGPPGAGMGIPALTFVAPSELPDYKPVFGPNSVRADADGRLWVRTISTKPMPGALYEVIDRSGTLVDRVLVPDGTTIIGFGAGGVVYLGKRDASGIHVQRARLK